jgi:putative aldouronate transport system permease protein
MADMPTVRPVTMHSNAYYVISGWIGRSILNLILIIISLGCVLPFVVVISASLSTEEAISDFGYTIFPREFSTLAYQYILLDAERVGRAYGVSILVTVVGGALGMLIMSLLAFSLSRKQFKLRQPIAFYLFFTMLFSGGLVPSYILITQYLHIQNSLWVLIVPGLVSPWSVLILRTFFRDLPEELLDAAKMDGADEWRIFFQIALPLCTPGLATIALFTMLGYWNDWYTPLLYIDKPNLYPIQYLLYTILHNLDFMQLANTAQVAIFLRAPLLTARMAMAVLAIGPIALAYLFLQRFFIRGIRLGSIKG